MTPEQSRRAEIHASGLPLRRSSRTISTEPPIRDPARLAEVRTQLMGKGLPIEPLTLLAEFGRALRSERERLGLSLSEMSARCGIEKGAISKLENGLNANPTLETLQRCATALGKVLSLSLVERERGSPPPVPADADPVGEPGGVASLRPSHPSM
jgi:transcriptional regulator with XRE-family HTH domain